ncbi:MAG TPA: tRNA pseudouridine(55) synthase TruB [Anaerolineales bacterium]|nr:tRNA pseudouridine(55) synthase TruB [Anaerolineales bacterium]
MSVSNGLILIDKPIGPTSHDVVAKARRALREKRIGHVGTLDPLASGLLGLLVGAATRLSEYLVEKDKRYRAVVRFGRATTTYDSEGEATLETGRAPELAELETALAGFRGLQQQRPPAYSAIKRDGQRAYALARRGEEVVLEPRPVTIHSLDLESWESPDAVLAVHCSSGTYIRSLAHDLGQALGCGAHLAGLQRTAVGPWTLAQASALSDLESGTAPILPMDAALPDWPRVDLDAEAARRIWHGNTVPLAPKWSDPLARAYNPAGIFFAILRADPEHGVWRADKVLLDPA